MIKITVAPEVLQALKEAFPTPAKAAQRALDKYVTAVEEMIDEALRRGQKAEERKLGLYSISLQQLANRGGQIGSNRIRVHKWLADHKLEIVQKVVTGSKFTHQVSQVKLTGLATLARPPQPSTQTIASIISDAQLDELLTDSKEARQALFDRLYPEFGTQWRLEELTTLFDQVPVDQESLKAFVLWLHSGVKHFPIHQIDELTRAAIVILSVATFNNGYFVQRKNPSVFGRMYYEGLSVQSVHKELRRAMLGTCWEYDIRSSVVAWKMGYASSLLLDAGKSRNIKAAFPNTLLYLEDKADFMATVRHYVFMADTAVPKDLQGVLLKRAFTAISFGARASAKGWMDPSGQWTHSALVDIIKNAAERQRFLNDVAVRGFIEEQRRLDAFICEKHLQMEPRLLDLDYLQTSSGRLSRSKLLAYLYQHEETVVMNIVRRVAAQNGHDSIANVHDAIFFKRRLSVDLKHEIELTMREETANPYWHLTPKALERFVPRSLDEERRVAEHRAWIEAEEEAARTWQAAMANSSGAASRWQSDEDGLTMTR